jgi:hypothetical protein
MEKRYPLVGFPPGRYSFRVVSVDPLRPDWTGPESDDLEVVIEPTPDMPEDFAPARQAKPKKDAAGKAMEKKK